MCGALFFASILDGVVGMDATVGKVGPGPRNRVRRFSMAVRISPALLPWEASRPANPATWGPTSNLTKSYGKQLTTIKNRILYGKGLKNSESLSYL